MLVLVKALWMVLARALGVVVKALWMVLARALRVVVKVLLVVLARALGVVHVVPLVVVQAKALVVVRGKTVDESTDQTRQLKIQCRC